MNLSSLTDQTAPGTQEIDEATIQPPAKRTRVSRTSRTGLADECSNTKDLTANLEPRHASEAEREASIPLTSSAPSRVAKPIMSQLGTKKSRKGCIRCESAPGHRKMHRQASEGVTRS